MSDISSRSEKIQISREYDTPGWISQSKQSIPISDWRAEPLSFVYRLAPCLRIPDADLSKERIFFACVINDYKRLPRCTVIRSRSHGPLSVLTQGLSLNIYLCLTECLRCNSRYTHQYQLERRYGTEGEPQKCRVTFLCVSTLGWQRTLSVSVVIMTETLFDNEFTLKCSIFLGWKRWERRFWNTLQMQLAGK